MHTGKQADYYWLEIITPAQEWVALDNLLARCPEFVLGRYMVITAWDSGPLKLRDADFKKGWMKHDRLAINPAIQSVNDIPYTGYDEWYLFTETPLLEPFKIFVNDALFSLCDPEAVVLESESSAAPGNERDKLERMQKLQELFWLQLELKRAETYVSAGHRLILATRQAELYEIMVKSLGNQNHTSNAANSNAASISTKTQKSNQ
jgi:hypothetical protein